MAENLYVVIATAGRPTLLERTLESLAECEKPTIYRKTIVVENGPPHGAKEIAQQYVDKLNLYYLHVSHANKSHALNKAMECLGDNGLIVFTDDDVRFHPHVLVAYAQTSEGINGGEYYGGPTYVDYEKTPPEWIVPALPVSARGLSPEIIRRPDQIFLGFNWAAFYKDLCLLGGFNPDHGPGSTTGALGDETEMQRRLNEHGVRRVPVLDAKVWHYVPKDRCSLRWLRYRSYQHGLSKGMLFIKPKKVLGIPVIPIKYILINVCYVLLGLISFNRRLITKGIMGLIYRFGQIHGYRQQQATKPT